MRLRTVFLGLGAIALAAALATPIILIPGPPVGETPVAEPVPADEQAAIITALAPPRRERPVIAIIADNDGTEVSDFLSVYGMLKRSGVADVSVVAERDERVRLYPAVLAIEPDTTIAAFDEAHANGADYVVVPAMDPGTDPVIAAWLNEQRSKGATIVSVCNGSRMLSTAGLLVGRRATGHWSAKNDLLSKNPTMQWVADRRYVVDNGVSTSTGITANVPAMLALIEAIGSRSAVERVAAELGVTSWDARHTSSVFALTPEHMKTFVRNTLTLWRHETLGLPIADGVDEVALGLMVDAYSRTQLGKAVVVGTSASVTSANGLTIYVDQTTDTAKVGAMLPPPPAENAGLALETVLPDIAARYDRHTADIVSLVMEYPWRRDQPPAAAN